MEFMVCPLRTRQFDIKDFWTEAGRCTYCGSISPEEFFKLVEDGFSIRLDRVNKSFNFTGNKSHIVFHHSHLDDDQRDRLTKLYNEKRITVLNDIN